MAGLPSVDRLSLGSQGLEVSAQGLGCRGMSPLYGMSALYGHALYGPFTNEILRAIKGIREKVQLATKFGASFVDGKLKIRGDSAYVRACCIDLYYQHLIVDCIEVDCVDLDYQDLIDIKVPIEVTTIPRLTVENFEKNKATLQKIAEIASRKGCSPSQLSLAWIHHQGNDVSPIPGTTKVKNLEENIGALSVRITPDEMKEIENILSNYGFSGNRLADDYQDFTWMNSETPPLSSWKDAVS